jgi:hypothetical protein
LSGRHGRFYTDTFYSSIPAISGKKIAQIFTNDIHLTKVYPMASKGDTSDALLSFIHYVGIPSSIHSDDAKEITKGKFKKLCQDYHIPITTTEPYSPWQNRAEGAIRELKQHVQRKMHLRHVPQSLWDFCCAWACDVRSKTAHKSFELDGRTPYEMIMGSTPDISSLIDYDFYEPIWYYDELSNFPEPKRKMARWLGEAHNIGQAMNYYILPLSGIPIVCSSIQAITHEERLKDAFKGELKKLDAAIHNKYPIENPDNISDYFSHEQDYDYTTPHFDPVEEDTPEADNWDPESYDQYISAQILLSKSGMDQEVLGTVIGRKRDAHGNPIGRAHSNPILDTRVYQVELPDGHVEDYRRMYLLTA